MEQTDGGQWSWGTSRLKVKVRNDDVRKAWRCTIYGYVVLQLHPLFSIVSALVPWSPTPKYTYSTVHVGVHSSLSTALLGCTYVCTYLQATGH